MSNKYRFLSFILLLLFVVFLSVGYSAFGNDMMISDIASNVRLYSDIRVTSVNIDSSNNGGISNYEDYNVSLISSNIDLPNEDSSVIYRVSVTNFGSMDMGIFDITGLSNNLDMEIDGYSLKDKICNSNGECNLGITHEFYITIKYGVDDDGNSLYDSSNINYDIRLEFDFRKFYSISYENIFSDIYPIEIMDGGNLELNFGIDVVNNISVYVNNIIINNYSVIDGIIRLENVTGIVRFVLNHDDIYITDISCVSNNSNIRHDFVNVYNTSINNNMTLFNDSSLITYDVTIYNSSDDVYYFDDIYNISYSNSKIIYELDGIGQNDVILAGDKITFKIKFHYVDYVASSDNILESNFILNFRKLSFVNLNVMNGGYNGTVSTVNVDNYSILSKDNFFFEINSITVPEKAVGTMQFMKSYNSNTGVLTITRNSIQGNGIIQFSSKVYGSIKAKLLGSYSGGYTISVDCKSVIGYGSMTVDDFIFDLKTVEIPGESEGTMQFTKSYNSNTGILTINRSSIVGQGIILFYIDVYTLPY